MLNEGFLRCEHDNGDGQIAPGKLKYFLVAFSKHSSQLGLQWLLEIPPLLVDLQGILYSIGCLFC